MGKTLSHEWSNVDSRPRGLFSRRSTVVGSVRTKAHLVANELNSIRELNFFELLFRKFW